MSKSKLKEIKVKKTKLDIIYELQQLQYILEGMFIGKNSKKLLKLSQEDLQDIILAINTNLKDILENRHYKIQLQFGDNVINQGQYI